MIKSLIHVALVFSFFAYGTQDILPVCERTPQVQEAIVKKFREKVSTDIDCKLADTLLDQILELSLYDQGLTSLKVGDFSGLTDLRGLVLTENKLSVLPQNVFSGLSKLNELNLSNNKFTELPKGMFSGLSSLTALFVSNNSISSINPQDIMTGIPTLGAFFFDNNNLSLKEEKDIKQAFRALRPGMKMDRTSLKWKHPSYDILMEMLLEKD